VEHTGDVPGLTGRLLLVWLQPSIAALSNQAAFVDGAPCQFKLELADAEALLLQEPNKRTLFAAEIRSSGVLPRAER